MALSPLIRIRQRRLSGTPVREIVAYGHTLLRVLNWVLVILVHVDVHRPKYAPNIQSEQGMQVGTVASEHGVIGLDTDSSYFIAS